MPIGCQQESTLSVIKTELTRLIKIYKLHLQLQSPVQTRAYGVPNRKLQYGSTVARQKNNSDSDVVPEWNQIQDWLMLRDNSPPNPPWESNLAKIVVIKDNESAFNAVTGAVTSI